MPRSLWFARPAGFAVPFDIQQSLAPVLPFAEGRWQCCSQLRDHGQRMPVVTNRVCEGPDNALQRKAGCYLRVFIDVDSSS